jgi:2-keto-3-deoxy-L-rhamnonate aldolase RhmA
MNDRLGQLLRENDVLYGLICRDATPTDLELMAQTGYHIVWIDLEHGPQSTTQALQLGRTATHLGLVPLVRILEASRTHVQRLLDGGIQVLNLPDVRDASQAAELVRLGKYPPLGERGVSSTSAGTNFSLGADTRQTLQRANESTHLMVMFESDKAYEHMDEILAIDGIDLATVGPSDWSVGLDLYGEAAEAYLAPKIASILAAVSSAGKTAAMSVSTPEDALRYRSLGARVLFLGVDVSMKRRLLTDSLGPVKAALE